MGAHLHPAEVEEVLHAHPAVARCAAFGVGAADGVEELHVAVVPAPGRAPDAARELGAFVTARLGAAYEPAAIHVMDRLPLTEAGKPDKVRLRSRYGGGADPDRQPPLDRR